LALLCLCLISLGGVSLAFNQNLLPDSQMQSIMGGACSVCNGQGHCSMTPCDNCFTYGGGSFSYCKAGAGNCTTRLVSCGIVSYCEEGEGWCNSMGGNDCSCTTDTNYVNGCY
jgi:hypothetical protein